MDINELRSSGMLELYVLGLLTEHEKRVVEDALRAHPSLSEELIEIAGALEQYARLTEIEPSASTRERILSEIRGRGRSGAKEHRRLNKGRPCSWFPWILAIAAGIFALLQFNANHQMKRDFETYRALCDSIENSMLIEQAMLDQIRDPDNQIVIVEPTEAYPETDIVFYSNPVTGSNLLQIRAMPELAAGQAFQLWSLKEGMDPVPLDVFKGIEGLTSVQFEPGSQAYAITIEPEGGSSVPTLDRLELG